MGDRQNLKAAHAMAKACGKEIFDRVWSYKYDKSEANKMCRREMLDVWQQDWMIGIRGRCYNEAVKLSTIAWNFPLIEIWAKGEWSVYVSLVLSSVFQ